MESIPYTELVYRRIEAVKRLTEELTVPGAVSIKHPIVREPLEQKLFLGPPHLFSTALYSFGRENGSYYLRPTPIPKRKTPEGIYVPAEEPEALIHRVKLGDRMAFEMLLDSYKRRIEALTMNYFAVGYERKDIIALGMFSLLDAAFSYDFTGSSFNSFFITVLKKDLGDMINHSKRPKSRPLNTALSLDAPYGSSGEDSEIPITFGDIIADPGFTPEELVLSDSGVQQLMELVAGLSELEARAILTVYVEGKSYLETSREIGCNLKSVDNALNRGKKRLERAKN